MTSTALTRKRLRAATPPLIPEMTTEVITLQAVMQEIREMRAERTQREAEFAAMVQQRDDELRRIQERISQLSPSNNFASGENASSATRETGASIDASGDQIFRGIKLKPDTYDGTAPLREFLSQFSLIAVANKWNETEKAIILASCLRGKARSLLDSFADGIESLSYAELKAKLELRFGENELTQNYYLQFTNRRQRPGEDFATLGADLERLSQKAYPECSHEVRDKIASSQFVAALSDGFVKRTLQVEGVASLKIAIERSKTLKFINQNCFSGKRDATPGESHSGQKEASETKKPFKQQKGNERRKTKECWGCGATGHFRSECPAQKQEN
ncbi:uncharacterized protein LOC143905721 isoform X2 [Temnothorax americanus]|uniref:uncharacterized protein LOC143905721 isoform X2 n=1 Tax=Temnothorax americanus TaxID=1964332 RepID=UPI004067FB52